MCIVNGSDKLSHGSAGNTAQQSQAAALLCDSSCFMRLFHPIFSYYSVQWMAAPVLSVQSSSGLSRGVPATLIALKYNRICALSG